MLQFRGEMWIVRAEDVSGRSHGLCQVLGDVKSKREVHGWNRGPSKAGRLGWAWPESLPFSVDIERGT
ncbi:hypothetical protein GH714_013251 [Hevea brasiliensis]|uniref:Uncharacterized protein n=1 Tax=Hevea brasiliensis TaxID=3981 RepID=A0A6A6NGY3_HEVBR|nr:hypothetical protein GH714_013251 [Hevea brasiliensis]